MFKGKAHSMRNWGGGNLFQAWDIKFITHSCHIMSRQRIFRKKLLVSIGYLVYLQVEMVLWMWNCVLSLIPENSHCEKWMDVLWVRAADKRRSAIQSGQNVPHQSNYFLTKKWEGDLFFDCLILFCLTFCAHCLLRNEFLLCRLRGRKALYKKHWVSS